MLQVPRDGDEGGRATSGSAGKEEQHHTSPQNPLLDCSVCGKVFSSTSSRSKHYLTHSQERKHVCGICSKAFKRKDHLTRHMLTHQKNKPFVCMEQGCSKSYCDDRSLRRHDEVQHGLCILKEAPANEEACGASSPAHKNGNTYRLPDPVNEESTAGGCDKWLSPRRKQDQQVKATISSLSVFGCPAWSFSSL
ncbi:Zinc finger protein 541 [Manis javanica]|nr:Zinc finger protein 541 [Manis javanica]